MKNFMLGKPDVGPIYHLVLVLLKATRRLAATLLFKNIFNTGLFASEVCQAIDHGCNGPISEDTHYWFNFQILI